MSFFSQTTRLSSTLRLAALASGLFLFLTPRAAAQGDFQGATHMVPFDEDTLHYAKSTPQGAVAQLQSKIASGAVHLPYDRALGYLPALLQQFGISPASQMLVFSKTSFQRERISPTTPRAIFFNDSVYIGFIPGSPLLEVSTVEPDMGAAFYSVKQDAALPPQFIRTDQCLECHASSKSMGVPGHLARSFVTDEQGVVDLATGISPVNHTTPLEDRWGGWYVTGQHGSQTHRGNLIGKDAFERHEKNPAYQGNITDLTPFFDVKAYPRNQSDIVALMVLEHQTHLQNFITRFHFESVLALQQYGHLRYLKNISEALLKYLLFVEETPLTSPITGSREFASWFEGLGPKDHQGRSLRQLDLHKRLFKYPCSYLIYSSAFDALPTPAKELLYQRLSEILSGNDARPDFDAIDPGAKKAVLDILKDTKPDFAAYLKKSASH